MDNESTLDQQRQPPVSDHTWSLPSLPTAPSRRRFRSNVATLDTIADLLLMVLALAAGGWLRLWRINSLGFNADEAVYASQAAGVIGDATLQPFFPVFRAHPLLFQFLVSFGFRYGVSDLVGRLYSVAFGLATIYLVYRLGALLYGRRAGVIAALLLALMPYHVVVTRQMILDGPMTFCATLSLYLMARFASTEEPRWLYATGAVLGLAFLTKETSIILVGAMYAFLALSPAIRVRIGDLVLSLLSLTLVMAVFPLSLLLAGGGGAQKSQSYLIWQLFRRPNHDWTFYPTIVPFVVGPLVILVALIGLWVLRREGSWRERLLLAWIVVTVGFFQLWPVKGFQYLLPIAPAIAVLAARTLSRCPAALHSWRWGKIPVQALGVALVAASLVVPSWRQIQPPTTGHFLAGSGGVPGGREAGLWIRANVPKDAVLLTVGPSMANILQFYGHRKAYGLSVSPNPLHRNPSYEPVRNPDLLIRTSELQYLVYDSFSAGRAPFFGDALLRYAERYHGRVVHTESVMVETPEGATVAKPVIIIYEVRP